MKDIKTITVRRLASALLSGRPEIAKIARFAGLMLAAYVFCGVCGAAPGIQKPRAPVVTSEWKRLVHYPGNHLNDFCIFQDTGGLWHAIGIMGKGSGPSEISFFHCTSDSLVSEYQKQPQLLTEMPAKGLAPQKHAPHVIRHNDFYYMFYRRPPGTIMKMKSKDPNTWTGLGEEVFSENDARDICILNIDGTFYMYYCQYVAVEGKNRSAILLRKSPDLESWGAPVRVYVDMEYEDNHSKLESPFVVREKEGYYLFIRHRHMDKKVTTVVLFSENPEQFPSGVRTWFHELHGIHAAEIVKHENRYYIARVCVSKGGAAQPRGKEGWLDIAELEFQEKRFTH